MIAVTVPRYSLVVPFFNEAANIRPLLAQAVRVLQSLPGDFEALLIDDGSTDGSARELEAVAAAEPRCRVIRLGRNRGQAAALHEGLRQARGEIILTMDGDGQNDPGDFPALLERLERDRADLACGVRTPRHDSILRRLMSALANRVRRRFLCDGAHDAGCQLRAFRREIVAVLRPSPLLQAFLPAMAAAAGFRLTEVPVRHHPRLHGSSHYGLRRLWWRPMMEMLRVRRLLRQPPP
jgi:glycosyltransferase involved in cell wall biosynthesis